MADQAQLSSLLETVDKQRTELDDKRAALAQAQKTIDDRDRRMQEAIKQNEEEERKMKQQIKLLEDKLKAMSLAGGSAAHAGGPGTGLTSSMMGAATGGTPPSAPTNPTVPAPSGTVGSSPAASTPASTDSASAHVRHRHRLPTFKMEDDVESFLSRYECYCKMEHMDDTEKAGHLILALDPKVYSIIDRELTIEEKNNYDTLKRHLIKRFDIYKEAGLRRVLFTQLKREIGETQEDYYSRLLEAGNKAFTEESGATIDRMIRDQFMVRNDDKTRLYLIEKSPQTAREALSLAISFQAAHSFNDTMKDAAVTIASTEVNNGENRENRANTGNRMQERNSDNRNFRVSFNNERQSRNRNDGQNRSRESSRDRSWDRSRQDRRESGNSQVFFSDDYQSSSGESSRNSSRESSPESSRRSNRNNSRRSSRSNSRRSSRGRSWNSSREGSRDRYFSSPHGRYTYSYSGGLEPREDELYPYSYTEGNLPRRHNPLRIRRLHANYSAFECNCIFIDGQQGSEKTGKRKRNVNIKRICGTNQRSTHRKLTTLPPFSSHAQSK
jgi:hypothetical protein